MADFDELFSSIKNNYQIYDITTRGCDVLVSGRYDNNKNFNVTINDFKPYFYVPLEKNMPHYFKPFMPQYDCEKLYLDHPKQIREEREKYKYSYEGDMFYDIRFHTDMMIGYKSSSYILPRYWLYDIEVFSNFNPGMPKPDDINRPVNAITFYDNYLMKYFTIVVLHDEYHKHIEKGIVNTKNRVIIKVGSEYELFVHFIHLIKKLSPNCFSGWNSTGFDDPYVCIRLKTFYPDLFAQLSPFGVTPYFKFHERDNIEEWLVPGIVFLDYMLLYKKYNQNKREAYGLDFIAKVELKEDEDGGKLKYEGTLDECYAYNFDAFLEYNIRDVELLVKLDAKLMFILLVNEMKEISTSPMRYFNFKNTTKFVDSLICKYIRSKDVPFVMRTRPNVMNGGKFAGANVRIPLIGFHEWLIDLDASLPPDQLITIKRDDNIFEVEIGSYQFHDKDETLTIDEHDNICWRRVLGHIEHDWNCDVHGDLLRIETENGEVVVITPNHSIFVERKGSVILVRGDQLQDGDMTISIVDNVMESKLLRCVVLQINKSCIKNILKIDNYKGKVFDISVEGTERFVARDKSSNNKVLVHNSSMYPSIIRSLNISPETWFCKIVIDNNNLNMSVRPYLTGNVESYPNNLSMVNVIYMDGTQKVEKLTDLKNNLIHASGGLGNYTVATNGSIFLNNGWGIIPEIQQDLVDNRSRYKDLKKVWGYVDGYLKSTIQPSSLD